MGTQVRGHVVDVVWWANRIDIDCNDIEARECTNEVNAFARGQTAPRRRRDARRNRGVETSMSKQR